MGLPADEVQTLLTTDTFGKEVREDEEQAYEVGVHGVPFFLIDKKFVVSGAQPISYFVTALNQA